MIEEGYCVVDKTENNCKNCFFSAYVCREGKTFCSRKKAYLEDITPCKDYMEI